MAHFAKMENSLVIEVITVDNDNVDNLPFPQSEPVGQTFIAFIGLDGNWLQTSYNNNFRAVYAGIGYTYDAALDIFVAPPVPTPEP